VANRGSNYVSVLINKGDGSFTTAAGYAAHTGPCSVLSKDLERDGDYDLATANFNSHDVSILINNGTDDSGMPVSSGVYLTRFTAGNVVQTKKMLLVK